MTFFDWLSTLSWVQVIGVMLFILVCINTAVSPLNKNGKEE